jgi:hypothetical protein
MTTSSLLFAKLAARAITFVNVRGNKRVWLCYDIHLRDGRVEEVTELYQYGFKMDLDPRKEVLAPR